MEFRPSAIAFEFHDYRRVELAQISEGVICKFGRIRQLVLNGLSENGNPVKATLNGHPFPPQFDMLRLFIEQRYGLRFPEKIIIWRLLLVLFDILFLLAAMTIFLITYFNQINR